MAEMRDVAVEVGQLHVARYGLELLEPRALLSAAVPTADVEVAGHAPLGVARVFADSTEWTQPFRQHLIDVYEASSYGWELTNIYEMQTLRWVNVNRITVQFNQVLGRVETDDLRLRGVNIRTYPESIAVSISAPPFQARTAATWTLPGPITVDRLVLEVASGPDGVIGGGGSQLDGNRDNVQGDDYRCDSASSPQTPTEGATSTTATSTRCEGVSAAT